MSMLSAPLFELDINPEAINSERNNSQEQPLDPVTKQLNRRAVKI